MSDPAGAPRPLHVSAPEQLNLEGPIISIGNFDGVHLGHRELLGRMRDLAAEMSRPSLVVTFFPPAKVVFGDATYLSSAEEKAELLSEFTPTAIVTIPFSRAYATTDKERFVSQLERLAPDTIVVGEDFRFGHNRAGSLADLRGVARSVEAFGMVTVESEVVKSSSIRRYLESGDIARANRLLGRPYVASGQVVSGAKRGRTIGFPTANVATGERKALPLGVYAVTVDTADGRFGGMANVGPRPSFPEEPPSLEVHLFDFDQDLYGQTVTTRFHSHLRSQQTFAGLAELKAQLAADEAAARASLTSQSMGSGEHR